LLFSTSTQMLSFLDCLMLLEDGCSSSRGWLSINQSLIDQIHPSDIVHKQANLSFSNSSASPFFFISFSFPLW
jgi:hypothetical protein